jgi:hypothetical protein
MRTVPEQQGIVLCDVDRTLFNSDIQLADLVGAYRFLKPRPGVSLDPEELMRVGSTTALFDTYGEIRKGGYSNDEISAALKLYAKNRDYLFPDAAPMIRQLRQRKNSQLQLITTGGDEGQKFKISLCPEIAGLPATVIQTDKGALLESCFQPDGSILFRGQRYAWLALVEDKAETFEAFRARTNLFLIHILRPCAKYPQVSRRPDVKGINHLSRVNALLP